MTDKVTVIGDAVLGYRGVEEARLDRLVTVDRVQS